MNAYAARLFDDAVVTRFTVTGEVPQPMQAAEALETIAGADVIFVGGGDPVQGARLLASASADAWLRDARARGTPCLGISAGAMMLAAWWATWPDHPAPGAPHDGGELVRCAGVIPDLVVDCHAEEDDWNELHLVRNLLAERPSPPDSLLPPSPLRFLGIPTGRGVIVGPDGMTEFVAGASTSLPPLAP
jgi:cyanophycinase-like exopeptidase